MESTTKTVLIGLVTLGAAYWIQPYRPVIVRGHSMAPTFSDGQLVMIEPVNRPPQRGDVVVLDRDGTTIVKRVAMGPGDSYRENYYKLIGKWMVVDTARERQMAREGIVPSRVSTVPPDKMYILGDNPDVSLDSRVFGFVPTNSIRGIIRLGCPF